MQQCSLAAAAQTTPAFRLLIVLQPKCATPALSCRSDALVGEVQREAENGRLLRLLMKLSYICERPELNGDAQWAETGDRCGGAACVSQR